MSDTGAYTFKWVHGAEHDVWVSGDFDDWQKTIQLEKKGDVFEKTVELKSAKHLYKFIVDGRWLIDESKPTENDQNSIANNVLQPDDIKPPTIPAISSVGPESTTAAMVGSLPKENVPGSFPETPGTETVSVNPIPASEGIGNPVQLKEGEKVPDPSTIGDKTIDSTVKLDKESYENADAGPAADAMKSAESSVPPVSGTMIPESSLPMGDAAVASPFISSAGAGSTTAAMVADLPKEPAGVPEIVSDSQEAAKAEPEASANPEAVAEKKDVEAELKSKVPEAPAEGSGSGGIIAAVTGTAAAAAAAVSAAVVGTKDKAAEATTSATEAATSATESATTTAKETVASTTEAASSVPEVVKESIAKAGDSAEAAANPDAVAEKKDVEAELTKEIKPTEATGEPAPTATAATTDKAPEPTTDKAAEPTTEPETPKKEAETTDSKTPTTDKKSKRKSFFNKIKKILK